MTEGTPDNGNGRVTLALVGQKLDMVDQKLDKFIEAVEKKDDKFDERLRSVEAKSNGWNLINSIAAAIAVMLAALFGSSK